MVCIYCGHKTNVTNSRHQRRTNEIWRRRNCMDCGSIFTTYEAVELTRTIVVQYSPSRMEPFERDRLFAAVYDSCRHQPKAISNATALTQTIISQLLAAAVDGVIQRAAIVAVCTEVLNRFDGAAATIYAAYHST